MDFEDSPEEARFRAEARAWLDANAKLKTARDAGDPLGEDDKTSLKAAKAWQAKKAEKGYARITWPKEVGGLGGTPMQQVIFHQEEAKYDVANTGAFAIGLGMCIPTLMAYGSKEAIARYVKPALRGDEIWCQLFSEPAGGSDVAALRTRAEKDGDDWVINGSKVWTTGAQFSDFGLLLARTDPTVPKHKGLTMFYLSMKQPGVEVRPIKQASGASGFNEIFFTNVRIPDSQRLGDVGQGWQAALTTLMHERLAVGGGTVRYPMVRTTDDKGGVALSVSEAGNLGTNILANYTITFDYGRSRVCMDYVPGYVPEPFGRAGLRALKTDPDTILLTFVNDGGPAAQAGLRKNDKLLSVDGRDARELGGGDLTRIFTRAPGTRVRVRYVRDGQDRDAEIVLREMLAVPGSGRSG